MDGGKRFNCVFPEAADALCQDHIELAIPAIRVREKGVIQPAFCCGQSLPDSSF
jgi:hypothetical protein